MKQSAVRIIGKTKAQKPQHVDEYIAGYPKDVQTKLQEVRKAIRKTAPKAEEIMSYGMPAYKWNGILVWFGAHTNHIGLYPRASGIEAFSKELSGYKSAKGSVQFPLDEPMPIALIIKIIKFRLDENASRMKKK
ncbi:MAG TPA: DUF1801 domain-containing protein [Bacteroidia bacterium]|jgi:uncharacterized protein YdhG (YjbR/CyaY superfamily)|nr:DUF1801 domain-containing protein [Bacteroidia bacterium]